MLVSHDYKFIFIKTKKTAGSSLETFLKPYCENGIIGKKLSEKHTSAEEIKAIVGEKIWSEYTKIVPVRSPWDQVVSLYFWRKRKRPFFYYPYRWLIKLRFQKLLEHRVDFKEWIKQKRLSINENREIMLVDGKLENYQYIRFENLNEDLKSVCSELNIPFEEDKLPHEKGGHRPKKDYKSHYDEETKEIVAKAFDMEIEEFGYQY